MYFTTDNNYSQKIFVRTISQHSQLLISCKTVSSIPACHSSSLQTCDSIVSDISSVFTATVRAYGVIGFPFARQQFANSSIVDMNTTCKLFVLLACIVLFQTTKPRNIRTIKKFSWVSWTTKLFLCKNFITPKFPRELQLIVNTLPWLLQC